MDYHPRRVFLFPSFIVIIANIRIIIVLKHTTTTYLSTRNRKFASCINLAELVAMVVLQGLTIYWGATQLLDDLSIINVIKVNISASIEQIVGCLGHDIIFIIDLIDLVIIKAIPDSIVLGISCIVTSKQLTEMVRDTKQVIDQRLA